MPSPCDSQSFVPRTAKRKTKGLSLRTLKWFARIRQSKLKRSHIPKTWQAHVVLFLCNYPSLALFLPFSFSLFPSLSFFLSFFLSFYLSLSLSLSFYLSVSLSLSLSLSLSVSLSLFLAHILRHCKTTCTQVNKVLQDGSTGMWRKHCLEIEAL